MADLYTTAQVSELTGIPSDTVRTWKRRYADKLLLNQHWLKDESNTLLWFEQGIEVLKQLQSGGELPQSSNPELLQSSNLNCSEVQDEPSSSLLNRYEPLLNLIADSVAPELQQRLDNKIMGKVQSFGKKAEPLTSTECVTILRQLGLKPCNPELLLSNNVAALNEGKED